MDNRRVGTKKTIPLNILPQYTCPNPGKKNDPAADRYGSLSFTGKFLPLLHDTHQFSSYDLWHFLSSAKNARSDFGLSIEFSWLRVKSYPSNQFHHHSLSQCQNRSICLRARQIGLICFKEIMQLVFRIPFSLQAIFFKKS